jgi:hypothetical protein
LPGLLADAQPIPSRESAPRTKVPAAQDVRPGGAWPGRFRRTYGTTGRHRCAGMLVLGDGPGLSLEGSLMAHAA